MLFFRKLPAFLLLLPAVAAAQAPAVSPPETARPAYDTTYRGTYYEQKRTMFESLPNTPHEVIMLGNSITDGGEWKEFFPEINIRNRGISGDLSMGVLARLSEVTAGRPDKIFLMIGVNDLARGIPDSLVISTYRKIVGRIRRDSPATQLYLQSVLPTNPDFPNFKRHQGKEANIAALNAALKNLAETHPNTTYLDLHPVLGDAQGRLDARFTNDGLHLNGEGYRAWADFLRQKNYLK